MPFSNEGGAQGSQHHQHINIDFTVTKAFDRCLGTVVSTGEVRNNIEQGYHDFLRVGSFAQQAQDNRSQGDDNQTRRQPFFLPPTRQ